MDAKKLVVGLVTAVSLMLFTGAVYAQQITAIYEDTARALCRSPRRVRRNARASRAGVIGVAELWHLGHRSSEAPGLDHTSQPARLRYR